MVAYTVENIGRRVSLNENVFPVSIVLQILLQYDLTFYTHDPSLLRNGANQNLLLCSNLQWPIDIFVKLNAPFEGLVSTFEALWYAQEYPFSGRNRKQLVKWLIHTCEKWAEISRRQGPPFGGEANAVGLSDLLRIVVGGNDLGRETLEDKQWTEKGREIREKVDRAALQ